MITILLVGTATEELPCESEVPVLAGSTLWSAGLEPAVALAARRPGKD